MAGGGDSEIFEKGIARNVKAELVDVVQIIAPPRGWFFVALRKNGTAVAWGTNAIECHPDVGLLDIIEIQFSGWRFPKAFIALRRNGTVAVCGDAGFTAADAGTVRDLIDVVQIRSSGGWGTGSGSSAFAALKKDGTVRLFITSMTCCV